MNTAAGCSAGALRCRCCCYFLAINGNVGNDHIRGRRTTRISDQFEVCTLCVVAFKPIGPPAALTRHPYIMLPKEVFGPLALTYLALKIYEDLFLAGRLLLPVYGNVLIKLLPIVALLIWLLAADTVVQRFHMRAGFALVFSMGGDIMLELKHLKHHFVLGLGSFFIAHIFYVWTFWSSRPKISILTVGGAVLVTGAIVYMGALFGSAAPPDLAAPVTAYCGVIGTMVVFSILVSDVPNRRNAIAGERQRGRQADRQAADLVGAAHADAGAGAAACWLVLSCALFCCARCAVRRADGSALAWACEATDRRRAASKCEILT